MSFSSGNQDATGRQALPAPGSSGLALFLPPQAVLLVILLLIVAPLGLLTSASLFLPLIDWVKALFMMETEASFTSLPLYFFLKLGIFLILGFFGVVQLLLRIKTLYVSHWARRFPRPHPLHTDYHPDSRHSMAALLNWNLYRFLVVVVPPVVLMVITAATGMLALYLINLLSGLPFISLPIQFILALFVMSLLTLLTGFSCLYSVWTAATTLFGDVVAMTEPELAAQSIRERCGRLVFLSPWVVLLYIAYGVFGLAVLAEVVWLFLTYNVQDIVAFRVEVFPLLLAGAATLTAYVLLNFLKFSTYHNALGRFYTKLPRAVRESQSPPPRWNS